MDRLFVLMFIWIQLILVYVPDVKGQDTADDVSKAFVTLAVLSGALIISIIMAKIFDYCYDRSTLRDDASDISEHTRKIIRQRLAVMKFAKKEKAKTAMTQVQRASHVLRVWSEKSKRRGSDRSLIQGAPPFAINVNQLQLGQKARTVGFATDTDDPSFRSTLNVPTLPEDSLSPETKSTKDDKGSLKPTNDLPICVVNETDETKNTEVNYVYLPQESGAAGAKRDTPVPKSDVEANKQETYSISIPRAETKSAMAMITPKFFPLKPNNSPKVEPIYNPAQDKNLQNRSSSSPPRIFIKQPTETDFESKFSRNLSSPRKIAPLQEMKTTTNVQTPKSNRKQSAVSPSRPGRAESVSKGGTGRPRVLSSPSGGNIDKKGVHFKTSQKNRNSVTSKSR